MFSAMLSRLVILCLGILYPAYASYKAIKTKSPKDYVKWMMYWVVFSLFMAMETFTDIFLAFWFPFYYEMKILIVVWLLLPATRGSSVLFRKFVLPLMNKHEAELDSYIERAKADSLTVFRELSTVFFQYLVQFVLQASSTLQNVARQSTHSLRRPSQSDDMKIPEGHHLKVADSQSEPTLPEKFVEKTVKTRRQRRNENYQNETPVVDLE